jgi:very-short-patch-repair endonuclease
MASPIARRLRSVPTEAEKRLWAHLRSKQLSGFRFRRQQPIGDFVVDFFCPEARVIVEVDGGQHNDSGSDERRDVWLGSQGYRVIRFWNNEVIANIEGVLETLLGALRAQTPHPVLPPQGGKEPNQ